MAIFLGFLAQYSHPPKKSPPADGSDVKIHGLSPAEIMKI